ncbi:transporter [Pseudomonas sp. Fig-3]|uniref:amino acid permease n=1 Tax=unclassified Pseudomonas TaxID=196821 RepID=UPI0011118C7A|nr:MULTISPECIES: amino acid permease [unclassified Pseudomonas]TNB81528.1 transporter [Pseudomonas sp. Fig-3]
MSVMTTESTQVVDKSPIPFTRYDAGWVILCIGMAIGGGIVFLPVQIGLKGLWVFLLSLALAYPALYMLQELYLKTLSKSEQCDDYTGVITHYLGSNWGFLLSVAYFLMLLKGMLTYSLAVTFDSASYLQSYGVSSENLASAPWYALLVLIVLVAIAAQGEKVLFKISGPMVAVKLLIVVILGFVMIPKWTISNIGILPDISTLIRDAILTLPFTLFSILFVQILSPMNIAYRKREADSRVATFKAIRANRIAYVILAVTVIFFALSFTFALTHEQAVEAAKNNISALAIASKVLPGRVVATMSIMLNIFAIVTAFFGIYLGFQEALKGMALNVMGRFMNVDAVSPRFITLGVAVFIIALLWCWVMTKFSILLLQQIGAPVYGVVSCLIPCYLVFKVPVLRVYKSWKIYYIGLFGVMLCIAPFLKLLEK